MHRTDYQQPNLILQDMHLPFPEPVRGEKSRYDGVTTNQKLRDNEYMTISDQQNEAVQQIIEMLAQTPGYKSRAMEGPEAISSAARLAGSFLFRSFGLDTRGVKPGGVLMSGESNSQGPRLIGITFAVLQQLGVQLEKKKMPVGNPLPVSVSFVDSIAKIQKPALEIMESKGLSFEEMSHSAAIATALIIHGAPAVVAEDAFVSAIFYFIEGANTVPPDFNWNGRRSMLRAEEWSPPDFPEI